MSTHLACVVFDADQPRGLAGFWAELLGWPVVLDTPERVDVAPPDAAGCDAVLSFRPAGASEAGSNRMHLDLCSRTDEHRRRQVRHAVELGARAVDLGRSEVPWTVLADPEGNEFCVLEPRVEYEGTGPVAALVVAAADPDRLAEFWSRALGWPVARRDPDLVGLRSPTGLGAWLEFSRAADTGGGADGGRLHLDLEIWTGYAEELTRLCVAGATPVDGGDPGAAVLADPEANVFRLLRPAADRLGA
ncbi:MAG TPA: VOC family protein [Nocardia sp.]|uniref:VOC family protein n=1 Tax=Nocardia TaxID=1817 RepID=UPI0024541736|nr:MULTISPECIES: VOC family protein [Nocardia]HLS77765.1 VOC family protein [Nocardia sp.]